MPVFIADPSSFHKPMVSSKYHNGMFAGAVAESDEGIGKVSVAFLPGAICNNSPDAPVNSMAAIPND